jgi:hypothetical protein
VITTAHSQEFAERECVIPNAPIKLAPLPNPNPPHLKAIDFWMGSIIMHIWEFFDKESAAELATTVGAGLLVGDGLWAIPSSILAIVQKVPPLCMGFYPKGAGLCTLPYCMGFWAGGSDRVPT